MRAFPHQEEQQMTLNELFKNTTYDDIMMAIDSEVALKQGGLSSLITLALSMSMKWKALI